MTDNEINELLAIEVMGWKKQHIYNVLRWVESATNYINWIDWSPITNISQALMCVDKYADKYGSRYEEWSVGRFTNDARTAYVVCINDMELFHVDSVDKLPRAICLALVEVVKK